MIKKITLGITAASAVVLGFAFVPLPISVDSDAFHQKASSYDVTVHRDKWGVPHIYGKRDRDVAFGLAYAQCEDDFETVQKVVLAMRGRLGVVDGPDAAKLDFVVHWLRAWDVVHSQWPKLSEETRAFATAYADGVNLYAADHAEELVAAEVVPVTGKDIIAGFVVKVPFFYGLDLSLKEMFDGTGSNAFAVAPNRSADGFTRLIVNSHQPFQGPVAWYEARLKSDEGLDIAGGTFPGAPLILHGHNRWLGWASTVNRPKLSSIVELGPNHLVEERAVELEVSLLGRLTWTVTETAFTSTIGPAVQKDGKGYALKFAGRGEARHLEQYLAMNKATTFQAWKSAMRMSALPSLNFVYADREGNVGFFYNAGFEGMAFDDLPQVVNPPSGFVFSVNHTPFRTTDGDGNPNPDAYPEALGIERFLNNRAHRTLETFGADSSITRREWEEYKYDDRYSPKSDEAKAVQEVLAHTFTDPVAVQAQEVLATWDLSTDAANEAAAIGVFGVTEVIVKRRWQPPAPDLFDNFVQRAHLLRDAHGRIDVPYGEVSRHIRGSVDVPVAGGPDVLRAIHHVDIEASGRARAKRGDSYLMFVEWDLQGTVTSSSVHPYGSATARPVSPHYDDQAEAFAERRLKPVFFEERDLMDNVERSYRLGK